MLERESKKQRNNRVNVVPVQGLVRLLYLQLLRPDYKSVDKTLKFSKRNADKQLVTKKLLQIFWRKNKLFTVYDFCLLTVC